VNVYAQGFKGVTCVLTGSNRAEITRLSQLPHVDLAFDKNTDLRVLAEAIRKTADTAATKQEAANQAANQG